MREDDLFLFAAVCRASWNVESRVVLIWLVQRIGLLHHGLFPSTLPLTITFSKFPSSFLAMWPKYSISIKCSISVALNNNVPMKQYRPTLL